MIKQLIFVFFLAAVSTILTPAQSNPDQAIQGARDKFTDIKNRSIELERMKREANQPIAETRSTIEFPKIKEDFEKIQKLNSDVLQPNVAKSPINYLNILKAVSELNHRAVRLKSNLFAFGTKKRDSQKNKQAVAEPQDVKILYDNLDESINSFVHSSIFQNRNLADSQASLKAETDLETVIKISSLLKEKAEKSAKNK